MNALRIDNLYFSYDEQSGETLKNISIEIEKGRYVSLLGHNGSGKSTLGKLIVGLLPFSKGKITISGIELDDKSVTKIRNKAAIVFQNPDNQFIGITVEDDIAFSLENRNIPKSEMEELVKEYARKVGMEEFLSKEPAYLSGGQKQRVAIADALVINPELLILDEATSMLDPKGKKDILDLIKKMRDDNPSLTILSITHDVEEAYLSDEVIILEKGEVVASGKPKEVFNNKELIDKYHLDIPFEISLKERLSAALNMKFDIDDDLEKIGEKICQSK